jgi:2-C-methyl-D-erythritol 2,4-cyclodiphosphate synthase
MTESMYEWVTTIGQDSHRFSDRQPRTADSRSGWRPLILGAVTIPDAPGLAGNSDADVLLHALTNAVSGLTGINVIGRISDEMCLGQGITDSRAYLNRALADLGGWEIRHVSFTIEGQRPHLAAWIEAIRESVAGLLGLPASAVGITATSGEGLTDFGRGDGLQVLCILSARRLCPD